MMIIRSNKCENLECPGYPYLVPGGGNLTRSAYDPEHLLCDHCLMTAEEQWRADQLIARMEALKQELLQETVICPLCGDDVLMCEFDADVKLCKRCLYFLGVADAAGFLRDKGKKGRAA